MFSIGLTPGSSRIYESVISPPCESPFAAMAAMSELERWRLVGTRTQDTISKPQIRMEPPKKVVHPDPKVFPLIADHSIH